MQAELDQYFSYLGFAILAGVGLFFLRIILSIGLKGRFAPGLVPGIGEVSRPDGMSRLVSLIGQGAAVPETLGTRRLRATLGLKLVFWGVLGLLAWTLLDMGVPAVGLETAILAGVLYLAIHTSLYQISYDRDSITLPRWWFGHTTRRWRDLDAVVESQGWYLAFHFRDGTVVQAHKYVVGYAELREAAAKALREV